MKDRATRAMDMAFGLEPANPATGNVSREPGGAELRSAPRFTMLLRCAKLISEAGEYLCVLRDASATGVKVRLFHPLPRERSFELELASGERFPLERVWEGGSHAGFRFREPIAIERLVEDNRSQLPKRGVRLKLAMEATLHSAGEPWPIVFRDISQQGACIACDKRLAVNELVRIDTAILPPLYAKVRWRKEPLHGLIFEQTFKLDELARLTAPLQTGAARPVEAAPARAPVSLRLAG